MKIVLDNSDAFITIESDIDPQRFNLTPLLTHCYGGRFNVEGLSLLIGRGANVSARDVIGRTCLHHCFYLGGWDTYGGEAQRALAGLVYLLSHGADPFAVDDNHMSVSEMAYLGTEDETSRLGDVWDAALADFGLDIADMRRKFPRMAYYRPYYTRRDFEELWLGREHLCPYYYDDEEEIWISEEESGQDAESVSDEASDSDDGGVSMPNVF